MKPELPFKTGIRLFGGNIVFVLGGGKEDLY